MKKLVVVALLACVVSALFARKRVACYWTVSTIVQTIDKDSSINYAIHFYGKRYDITPLQHDSLLEGHDIILDDSL